MSGRRHRFHVLVDADVFAWLGEEAAAQRTSRGTVIRSLLYAAMRQAQTDGIGQAAKPPAERATRSSG